MQPLAAFPYERAFPLDRWFPLPDSPVRRAWERSRASIAELIGRIEKFQDRALLSVYLSGSLGRMEGREDSDWDLIVVLDDDPELKDSGPWSEERLSDFAARFWERIDPDERRRPDPAGVYALPIQLSELSDPRYRSPFADSPARFGKRIQVLLDAKPIWGNRHAPLHAALAFYDIGQREEREPGEVDGIYLFNDLVRYHRSLCTLTQWLPGSPLETRRLKLKLRFTRFLNYLGLLLPLADGIDCGQLTSTIESFRRRTPLERVLAYANDANAVATEDLCFSYERFLEFLERTDPPESAWRAIDGHAHRFRMSACEILRSQPFLQRGRAADLLML